MVVKGSEASQLGYKLTNIELEYEVIHDFNLAREASSSYLNGQQFMYKHVTHYKTLTVKKLEDTIRLFEGTNLLIILDDCAASNKHGGR